MYLYVFITWLVANLFHPFFIAILFWEEGNWGMEILTLGFMIFFYSLLFSLPALLLGWLLIYLISRLPFDITCKFFVWLFLAAALPFVTLAIISLLFFKESIFLEELSFVLPATLSVVMAILLRVNFFFRLYANISTE